MMTDYQKTLEQYRLHYKERHGVTLDDEILYFIVRVAELHVDLRKENKALVDDLKNEIKSIPKPKFKGPWDFFVYGLGNFVNGLIIAATILIVYFTFKH